MSPKNINMFYDGIIVVFDLEWTSWPGSFERGWSDPGEHKEIIQFGAVKSDVASSFIEIAHFECLVHPNINPVLSDYITSLTGITQTTLNDSGISFPEAMAEFVKFIGTETTALCSNGYDNYIMAENCKMNNMKNPLDGHNFVNLRPLFTQAVGPGGGHPSSASIPGLLGLTVDHQSHTGLGDSRNILDSLRHLHKDQQFSFLNPRLRPAK